MVEKVVGISTGSFYLKCNCILHYFFSSLHVYKKHDTVFSYHFRVRILIDKITLYTLYNTLIQVKNQDA